MPGMDPSILRFEVDAPDSTELRYFLRHASKLLASSDLPSPQRAMMLRRARAWILAALYGVDGNLAALSPDGVPDPVVDGTTRAHAAADDALIPTLVRVPRSEG